MNHGFRFSWAIVLGIGFLSGNAWGWGGLGHNAVAIIAEKALTAKSRRELQGILGGNTLAQMSVWPDQIKRKSGWQHTAAYHYAGVPDNKNYLDYFASNSSELMRRGDVVLALVKAEKNLRDSRLSSAERKDALAFLVHFLGDLHQPFHSGRAEDRGGNDIRFRWFGRTTNLHAVWDSSLIEKAYFSKLTSLNDLEKAELYVEEIDQSTEAQRRAWSAGSYAEWLAESAEARVPAYSGYNSHQELYLQTFIDIVDVRILQAGYRLGNVLNSIFDSSAAKLSLQDYDGSDRLHEELQAIAGPSYLHNIYLEQISRRKSEENWGDANDSDDAWMLHDCGEGH